MGETIRYPNMGSTAKAAEIYGVTPHYIRLLCKAGKVRFVRYGRHILVNLDSLARYFEQGDPSRRSWPAIRRTASGVYMPLGKGVVIWESAE